MRWLLGLLAVLLLVWLASGDAKAQPPGPPLDAATPPLPRVQFGSVGPATFGAWIDLGTACLSQPTDHIVTLHFSEWGDEHSLVARIGCPLVPVYIGQSIPLATGAKATLTGVYAEMGDHAGLRIPETGFARNVVVDGPTGPAAAIAWSGGNVGVVAGLWAFAWWHDPTRRMGRPRVDVHPP